MRVLALDTTTKAGSVALIDENRVVSERRGDPSRTHAERLPADLMSLVHASGIEMSAIDVFGVASGPGSFTGLRVGIATIQGLAIVTGRRIAGVSALEALAHIAAVHAPADSIVGVWMDAHRGEVFSALFRVASAPPFDLDGLIELEPAAVGDPVATLTRWKERTDVAPAVYIGDGAILYSATITRDAGAAAVIIDPPPLAAAIGRLALGRARRGDTVDPAGIRPLYVRRPDAELARDRRDTSV